MQFHSPADSTNQIQDVVIRKLKVNTDTRGSLVEILRADWSEVCDSAVMPFSQCYYSRTKPGMARDENRWHVHQRQEDRFVVIHGEIILALYDPRPNSPTDGRLNLFKMGDSQIPQNQFMVLLPKNVLHGFLAVGKSASVLVNFPTRLYDPSDEGRIPFDQIMARFSDGRLFSWDLVRQ